MLKQLIFPFAAVAAFIVLVGLLVKNSGNINIPGLSTPLPSAALTKTIKIGDTTLQVEIADTPASREQGLSGRTDLLGNTGMLFVFDKGSSMPGFWMKGMLISLDLIWIKNGSIVKIDKNVQPPKEGTNDSDLKVYVPGQAIDNVLEVRGGFSDTNGISVGSKVDLSQI